MKLTLTRSINFKHQAFLLILMMFFSLSTYAQKTTSPMGTQLIKESPQLPPRTQQVKNLFEETYGVSLTNQELSNYMQTNADNLAKWKEVLKQNQKASKEDLAYLQQLVRNLSIKLESIKHQELTPTTKKDEVVANTEKVNPKNSTKSVAQVGKQTKQLEETSKNAKTLFEKTHKVSLTVAQFSGHIATSKANLVKWEKVLAENKNNPATDISYVSDLVKAMNAKIEEETNKNK